MEAEEEVEGVNEGGEDSGAVEPTTATTTTTTTIVAAAVALAVERDCGRKKEEERTIETGDGYGGNGRDVADSIKRSQDVSKNKENDSRNVSDNYSMCGWTTLFLFAH